MVSKRWAAGPQCVEHKQHESRIKKEIRDRGRGVADKNSRSRPGWGPARLRTDVSQPQQTVQKFSEDPAGPGNACLKLGMELARAVVVRAAFDSQMVRTVKPAVGMILSWMACQGV